MEIQKLRYPTGTLRDYRDDPSRNRQMDLERIETLPARLVSLAARFEPGMWDIAYRPEGWTARQVVHHIADSHLNAFCRMKLILTENQPVVKPYDENAWVQMPDALDMDPEHSIGILKGLHARMSKLIATAKENDWNKVCFHPEQQREISFEELVTLYAWHGNHHLGHLEIVLSGKKPG